MEKYYKEQFGHSPPLTTVANKEVFQDPGQDELRDLAFSPATQVMNQEVQEHEHTRKGEVVTEHSFTSVSGEGEMSVSDTAQVNTNAVKAPDDIKTVTGDRNHGGPGTEVSENDQLEILKGRISKLQEL